MLIFDGTSHTSRSAVKLFSNSLSLNPDKIFLLTREWDDGWWRTRNYGVPIRCEMTCERAGFSMLTTVDSNDFRAAFAVPPDFGAAWNGPPPYMPDI